MDGGLTPGIHAAECVRGLPQVFGTSRKPWVQPEQASGALQYERLDGGDQEPIPQSWSAGLCRSRHREIGFQAPPGELDWE